MVHSSTVSLREYINEEKIWQERIIKVGGTPNKDFSNFQSNIIELDAKNIANVVSKITLPGISFDDITIVSE